MNKRGGEAGWLDLKTIVLILLVLGVVAAIVLNSTAKADTIVSGKWCNLANDVVQEKLVSIDQVMSQDSCPCDKGEYEFSHLKPSPVAILMLDRSRIEADKSAPKNLYKKCGKIKYYCFYMKEKEGNKACYAIDAPEKMDKVCGVRLDMGTGWDWDVQSKLGDGMPMKYMQVKWGTDPLEYVEYCRRDPEECNKWLKEQCDKLGKPT